MTAWLIAGAIAAGVAVPRLILLVLGDMARAEMATRLSHAPYDIVTAAGKLVPPGMRDNLVAEWTAELDKIVPGTDGLPLTRLYNGIKFAAGVLRTARAIAEGLAGQSERPVVAAARRAAGWVLCTAGISWTVLGVIVGPSTFPGVIGAAFAVATCLLGLSVSAAGILLLNRAPRRAWQRWAPSPAAAIGVGLLATGTEFLLESPAPSASPG
jgi:hypothetical protein